MPLEQVRQYRQTFESLGQAINSLADRANLIYQADAGKEVATRKIAACRSTITPTI